MSSFNRLVSAVERFARRLGLGDLGLGREDLWRLAVLAGTCVVTAIALTNWSRSAGAELAVGDVAQRSVRAPFTFTYPDQLGWQASREAAVAQTPAVWDQRDDLAKALADRIAAAFAVGRAGGDAPAVRDALGAHLPDDLVAALAAHGWAAADEALASGLVAEVMSHPVATDRAALPAQLAVVRTPAAEGAAPVRIDPSSVLDLGAARERVGLILPEKLGSAPSPEACAALVRSLLRGNLEPDPALTDLTRRESASRVDLSLVTVPRGASLFRQGDVLTSAQVQAWHALQDARGDQHPALDASLVAVFLLLLLASLYQFGSTWLTGFRSDLRSVAAAASLLVLVAVMAKAVVVSSDGVAALIGHEAEPGSVWFAVPVAGAVMLVRVLLGSAWTVVFSVAAAVVCGFEMDLRALPVVYYLITGVAAGSLVEGTRERASVLRAGLSVGVLGAAAALVIHFVQLFVLDGDASLAATIRPVWSTAAAMCGGIASAFLVLGLLPLFESVGFVTDFRLMELANLNHPLMRQLMLRAPGSYHHSVLVGTLAEAACEAIGANALQARVSAYFHDIGKSIKPLYFIENQRGQVNRHESLDPTRSAQVIISHVVDGGRMAREHKLPKPIVDNIYMHHGTGLLQYFLEEARRRAGPGATIDESLFRYPGPRPNNREAGVIMLADKVEAATRTIRQPTEANIRAMIHRIINSVMADGQFVDCPLTFQEMSTIADTFVNVLLGIYHQRIEYASTADLSRAASRPPADVVITLELPSSVAGVPPSPVPEPADSEDLPADDTSDMVDYESVEHLPHGGGG